MISAPHEIYQTPFNFIKLVIGPAVSVFGPALRRFALSLYVLDEQISLLHYLPYLVYPFYSHLLQVS